MACACGGTPTPAAEPEPPAEVEAVDEAEPGAPGEPPDAPPDEPADTQAPAAELSEDDVAKAIEQVLSDPDLDQYLHLNKPGRLPVKVSGPGVPSKLRVVKGSYEVKVVDAPASEKDPVLVFTKIERDGDSVRLRYRYDVEGIRGSAVVFKKDGGWRLGANRVIEQ